MGLLDALFSGGGYGGTGGGLLDMIRTTQMQQDQFRPSAGLPEMPGQAGPIGVGGYQMPRIGSLAQFTPPQADPAAIPPNAQPTQGQMPQQPPMPQQMPPALSPAPGGFRGAMQGFAANAHNGPLGMLLGTAGGAMGMEGPEKQNARAQFEAYKGAGLSPQQAMLAVLNPSLADNLIGGGQTNDIKEFERAAKDPAFAKFLQQKKAVSGEYGLNYVYGTKDGKTVAFAPGKSGEPKQIQFPEGVEIARGIETVQTPTEVITRDKQSGVILSRERKDNAGKEADEKIGQAKGAAQAALNNGADIDAAKTIEKIDEFVKSKGFNEVFGQLDQYRPSWTHSDAGTDSLARYKQLKGTAFLSAYAMLKGGGAITDIEGQKAGDAMARLDRAQGEAEAKAALADFREAVDTGLKKLKRAANGGAEPAAAPAPTGGASVDDLIKKYGN